MNYNCSGPVKSLTIVWKMLKTFYEECDHLCKAIQPLSFFGGGRGWVGGGGKGFVLEVHSWLRLFLGVIWLICRERIFWGCILEGFSIPNYPEHHLPTPGIRVIGLFRVLKHSGYFYGYKIWVSPPPHHKKVLVPLPLP